MISHILTRLVQGCDLNQDEAQACFGALFGAELTQAQSGALLLGLRAKGETPLEMHAAVTAALQQAHRVNLPDGPTIDTCGTGGDNRQSFNCSSAVALFLAHMGYKVVKHGNRAISSTCGSADVMEALNIPFAQTPADVGPALQRHNFAFLFAPAFHPAFAQIAPIRRELGFATLFNLMGPLLNPTSPSHQLLGVGQARFVDLMASVLAASNVQKAAVVHGAGGFDELTPCGPSVVILIENHTCRSQAFDSRDYGFDLCSPGDLACPDKTAALAMMVSVLRGRGPQAVMDMVALNLGLALYLLESPVKLTDCMQQAQRTVAAGLELEAFHA